MKQLGIAIWCVALAGFGAQLMQAQKADTYVVFLVIALLVYLPILLYSWLWGRQRGHVAHLAGIVVAAYFSVLLLFRDSIPSALLGLGVCAGILVLCLLVRRFRPGFMSDFKRGIRRDHFRRKAS